ncbi:hypothetical protein [[Clostridium] fimetarium]|uniref:Uncharacterized protein n=1 Tax=[Clostridium] fimetarium TaxID=99656 RepID=A0A1I0R027_9FIRM|nr:hypothetical protein [[Clostridium] fimetarium]SEW32792.1 hypothetical protein SAMN05421659_11023 [[Clostridium] fimetarium]
MITKKNIKIMLVNMILIVILTSSLGCGNNSKVSTEISSDASVNSDVAIQYMSIIKEYQKFADDLTNNMKSDFNNEINDDDLNHIWFSMRSEIGSYRNFAMNKESFGYALKDLNRDSNPELILLMKDYTMLAIFSTVDGKPKLLDSFWPRHRCALNNSNLLYTESTGGVDYWEYEILQISQDGSELLPLLQFGCEDGFYKIIDREKYNISQLEMEEFLIKYPILSDTTACDITKNSGIEFIPLNN